jgi:multiple sugar transport system permease protein
MKQKKIATVILLHIFALAIGLVWIIPFFGLFMTSIRPYDEVIYGWWDLSSFTVTFDNFVRAWTHDTASLADGMRNSLVIALPSTIVPLFLASIAAYGFVRFRFPLKNYMFLTIIALMSLPQQMIAIPLFKLMKGLDLLDTYSGLVLVHTAWAVPWILFFMRNYFTTLPVEIEEAAQVDGASDFTIFFKIILPVSIPALTSAAVLQFIWVWSDFFMALILLFDPNKLLATQRVPLMRGVHFVDWGLLSASAVLTMVVPILVFGFLQQYYVKGMVGWTTGK